MTTIEAYPLHWPPGFKRTKSRGSSRFNSSIAGALKGVQDELRLLGKDTSRPATNLIISSNVTLGQQRPKDPGVAVWFTWGDLPVCFPCDRYDRVECNLRAIGLIIESHRTIMRHGGLNLVEAAFRGFSALPPPRGADGQIEAPADWRSQLGFASDSEPDEAAIKSAWKERVKRDHPDRGGDPAKFNAVQCAYAAALEYVRSRA